ncbi:alpha/beta hydrolase [Bacillus sp. FJAT-49705]|uniref:Alpha/beta hydrolase n=1 Tax=Cytobacillus citreus TaxID=2833586 RepID=A0ABS5NUA8_9BACI|nr:alpha/beta hydrolase [Cytobacillus citreus]MBS4190474.1 alpha/beta hydrolase [Cytobacillus citreus]
MGKKVAKTISSLVLASSLGLTGVVSSFSIDEHRVSAEETIKEIDYEQRAKEFVELARANNWDAAYQQLSKNLQSVLSKDLLNSYWTNLLNSYGKIIETKFKDLKIDGVHTKATFSMTAEKGPFELVILFNSEGKVDEFYTDMVYQPNNFLNPSYNHPENYTEKQITIGEGEFSLPGVLTIPKGKGPFPVVVLVHGSGAHDMDETMYSIKPFRDIAVGLANEGVAVLRYDKRTKVHPIKSSLKPMFSIQEETVLDANLAVEKLKSLPEIDSKNIFVLGHSQGAFALPLIINNDKKQDIKGVIGAAGPAGKFQDLLLWQLDQAVERAEKMNMSKEQIEAMMEQFAPLKESLALLNDPKYSKENLPAVFKIGNPYWWFDIRDYIPAELAKEQTVPTLLLQGGKDIQVPASELDSWKTELKQRDNVEYKIYPDMYHMLADFPGQPNGQTEYMTPSNVSQQFISDIAKWVKTGSINSKPEESNKPEEDKPDVQKPTPKVYWDGLLMKKGQIGKVSISKPINLWKRQDDKLQFVRVLKPGEQYRVYRYDNKFGGQYGLGGDCYITNLKGYVEYKTPSKAKLKELHNE